MKARGVIGATVVGTLALGAVVNSFHTAKDCPTLMCFDVLASCMPEPVHVPEGPGTFTTGTNVISANNSTAFFAG